MAAACYVRLFNELPPGGPAAALNALSPTLPQQASSYVTATCTSLVNVTATGYAATQVALALDSASHHFSVVVTAETAATLSAAALADWEQGYVDAPSTIDVAQLRIINALGEPVAIHGVATECFNCALPSLFASALAPSGGSSSLDVTTQYGLVLEARSNATGAVRASTTLSSMREHGAYTLILHSTGSVDFLEDIAGRDAYLPILYTFLILVALGVLHKLVGSWLVREALAAPPPKATAATRGASTITAMSFFGWSAAIEAARVKAAAAARASEEDDFDEDVSTGLGASLLGTLQQGVAPVVTPKSAATAPRTANRVVSLDTFRGLSLCIMMFVNSGGGRYAFFDHSKWNGLTVADLVFPWFVFMSGVSAAISFASERKRGSLPRDRLIKTLVRSLKLFCLGLFIVNNPGYLPHARIFSVLGYFAVSYLVIGVIDICLPVSTRGSDGDSAEDTKLPTTLADALWLDYGRWWAQWSVMLVLGAIYLIVQFCLPVPGCPTGYIGAGGLADQGAYPTCTGGAHYYIDKLLFTVDHIYQNPTCSGDGGVYDCGPYEPEGTLGFITASWMAWLGLCAGRALLLQRSLFAAGPRAAHPRALAKAITLRWVANGLVLCLIAGILCGFKKEGGPIPVNKNLWSPSFVLLLAGWGHLNLAALYIIVDVAGVWSGAPFKYIGANSLAVYLVSEVCSGQVPLQWAVGSPDGWASHAEALASNVGQACVLAAFARMMYLKKWFFNV